MGIYKGMTGKMDKLMVDASQRLTGVEVDSLAKAKSGTQTQFFHVNFSFIKVREANLTLFDVQQKPRQRPSLDQNRRWDKQMPLCTWPPGE